MRTRLMGMIFGLVCLTSPVLADDQSDALAAYSAMRSAYYAAEDYCAFVSATLGNAMDDRAYCTSTYDNPNWSQATRDNYRYECAQCPSGQQFLMASYYWPTMFNDAAVHEDLGDHYYGQGEYVLAKQEYQEAKTRYQNIYSAANIYTSWLDRVAALYLVRTTP